MKITTLVLAATLLTPTTMLFSRAEQRDSPAEVESARRALTGAYNDLDHAGHEWGGHISNAKGHIQEAIKELNEAEKFAREHREMK